MIFCIFKPYNLSVALYLKKFTKCKIIFLSGGTKFLPGYRLMIKKVDFLFACSEFNAKQIEKYFLVKPKILPYGIDTNILNLLFQILSLNQN